MAKLNKAAGDPGLHRQLLLDFGPGRLTRTRLVINYPQFKLTLAKALKPKKHTGRVSCRPGAGDRCTWQTFTAAGHPMASLALLLRVHETSEGGRSWCARTGPTSKKGARCAFLQQITPLYCFHARGGTGWRRGGHFLQQHGEANEIRRPSTQLLACCLGCCFYRLLVEAEQRKLYVCINRQKVCLKWLLPGGCSGCRQHLGEGYG